jgi:hypothetical protein
VVPIKKGYCRMCWMQASLEAKGQVSVLQPFLERICHHQLRFAAMQRPRQPGVRVGKQGRRVLKLQPRPPETRRAVAWTQLRMADVRRDYSGFERRRHADYANPALISARRAAALIAETHGWTVGVQADVDRALVILLSGHADGDTIRFSELFLALRRHNLSAERTIEVLQRVDLFDDDRTSSFESWLERNPSELTTMHTSGPTSRTCSRTSPTRSSSKQVGVPRRATSPALGVAAALPSRGQPMARQAALPTAKS